MCDLRGGSGVRTDDRSKTRGARQRTRLLDKAEPFHREEVILEVARLAQQRLLRDAVQAVPDLFPAFARR